MLPILDKNLDMLGELLDDSFFGENKLRKMENHLMKTDIKEKDGKYLISVDLPGYKKDEINLELEDGYLKISAEKNSQEKEEKEGYIRRERYVGSCSRSFYVGDISEKDIKAKYINGILEISMPREDKKDNKKLIDIE